MVEMWVKVVVKVLVSVALNNRAAKIGFQFWFKPFNISVYFCKLLNVSEPEFSHLKNGDNKILNCEYALGIN